SSSSLAAAPSRAASWRLRASSTSSWRLALRRSAAEPWLSPMAWLSFIRWTTSNSEIGSSFTVATIRIVSCAAAGALSQVPPVISAASMANAAAASAAESHRYLRGIPEGYRKTVGPDIDLSCASSCSVPIRSGSVQRGTDAGIGQGLEVEHHEHRPIGIDIAVVREIFPVGDLHCEAVAIETDAHQIPQLAILFDVVAGAPEDSPAAPQINRHQRIDLLFRRQPAVTGRSFNIGIVYGSTKAVKAADRAEVEPFKVERVLVEPHGRRQQQVLVQLDRDRGDEVGPVGVETGPRLKAVLAGQVERLAGAEAGKPAAIEQHGVVHADIGAGAAFVAVDAGELVVEEQVGRVKLEDDAVLVGDSRQVGLVGCGD